MTSSNADKLIAMQEKHGKKVLYCSFCGKSNHEVARLVVGPSTLICNECVALCLKIIAKDAPVGDSYLQTNNRYPTIFGIELPEPIMNMVRHPESDILTKNFSADLNLSPKMLNAQLGEYILKIYQDPILTQVDLDIAATESDLKTVAATTKDFADRRTDTERMISDALKYANDNTLPEGDEKKGKLQAAIDVLGSTLDAIERQKHYTALLTYLRKYRLMIETLK